MQSLARVYRRLLITLMQLFKSTDRKALAIGCLSFTEFLMVFCASTIISPASIRSFLTDHWAKLEFGIFLGILSALNSLFLHMEDQRQPLDDEEADNDFLSVLFIPAAILVVWAFLA